MRLGIWLAFTVGIHVGIANWGNIKSGNNLSVLVKNKLLLQCVFLMSERILNEEGVRHILARTPHLAQHSP